MVFVDAAIIKRAAKKSRMLLGHFTFFCGGAFPPFVAGERVHWKVALCNDVFYDLAVDIGEAEITSAVAIGEPFMV